MNITLDMVVNNHLYIFIIGVIIGIIICTLYFRFNFNGGNKDYIIIALFISLFCFIIYICNPNNLSGCCTLFAALIAILGVIYSNHQNNIMHNELLLFKDKKEAYLKVYRILHENNPSKLKLTELGNVDLKYFNPESLIQINERFIKFKQNNHFYYLDKSIRLLIIKYIEDYNLSDKYEKKGYYSSLNECLINMENTLSEINELVCNFLGWKLDF